MLSDLDSMMRGYLKDSIDLSCINNQSKILQLNISDSYFGSLFLYRIMKLIDKQLLDKTSEAAKRSPRLRMNYNFHEDTDDLLNRFMNAIEPDSYIRPHRHMNPDKEEIFILLRGKAAFFVFDDEGNITEQTILSPADGVYGAEIGPAIWHCLLVLEPDTVVYEIKRGPFAPLTPDNFAPWSPEVENVEAVKEYMDYLRSKI